MEYRSYAVPEVGTERSVYFPNTTDLFRKTYEWLDRISPRGGRDMRSQPWCGILEVHNTKRHPGYLLRILRRVYHEGFNVEALRFTNFSKTDRGIAVALCPFHDERSRRTLSNRLDELRKETNTELNTWESGELKYSPATVSAALVTAPTSSRSLESVFEALRERSDPPTDGSRHVTIVTEVANIPGMFYRVVERIHAFEGAILGAAMEDMARGLRRSRISVSAEFPLHGNVDADLFRRPYQALEVCLSNELRFLLGVYDVSVAPS